MKILLIKLSLVNFKGIRKMDIDLDNETNIYGRNASGKTTLMDAFLWLFFGKDSSDRKDFEIKTLDENNQPYHRLDHEVSALVDIDGQQINIRRTYKEKWTKKRGSESSEFSGHQTDFFWNDVPMKENEYQARISGLINENIFKLLTNTGYYNSLKWQDRRTTLMQIAGHIDDQEILDSIKGVISSEHMKTLMEAIKQNKHRENFKDFRLEIGAKKKKIKDELEVLPSRIDEANRGLPEETDYSVIESNIAAKGAEIDTVDGLLNNKSQAHKDHQDIISKHINRAQVVTRAMSELEFRFKNDVQVRKESRESNIRDNKSQYRTMSDEFTAARRDYTNSSAIKDKLTADKEALSKKWFDIDTEKLEFKEGEFCCPACKREFEAGDIEEKKQTLTANFNTDKSNKLNDITKRGKELATEIADLETKLSNLKAKGEKLKMDVEAIAARIVELEEEHTRLSGDEANEILNATANSKDYKAYKKELEELTEKINTPFKSEDNSELILRKRALASELDVFKDQMSSKGQREKQLQRIDELMKQERKLAGELAGFEGIEFAIEKFTKAKMDTLETKINLRFKIVRFKMFEEQINGAQLEACTTLIGGVPYADANTAAKIQAGLDIINTLSDHYGIQAPVWVDNRESVTELPETNCQLINLIVSPKDKKLRIESAVKTEEMA